MYSEKSADSTISGTSFQFFHLVIEIYVIFTGLESEPLTFIKI